MATEMSKEGFKGLELTELVDLNNELGRGAFGIVKEVSLHGTKCAAKVIHEILLVHATKEEHKKIQKMFMQECLQCSNLRHPNLVQFLGIYYPSEAVSLPWLVMEKLHASLTNLLQKYSQDEFSFSRKISILQDISLGIQYLHSKNIVHRDISSNNILLTKHLVAKLSDFGVAKMIDPQLAKTHTQVPGTLIFMPPESTSVKPQYHTPVDVFSFGCVTVHMMTHQWPIPEDQVTKDLRALSEIERRKKYLQKVKIIQPLMMLIAGCLKNAPDQRPTISEVVQKLQAIVTDQSLFVYANVLELEKSLQSKQSVETMSANKDVVSTACHKSRCVKLCMKAITEKTIQLSESFSQVMENIKLPDSMFPGGSHFVYTHGGKAFVLSDMKKCYNFMGRFVVVFDLQNGTLDLIDKEVRRFCPFKNGFIVLERDPKSPGKVFYELDPSNCKWVSSSIEPLPTSNIKYPDMLVYSSLLLVISESLLQVFSFDLKQWFSFKLAIADGTIKASLTTSYAILNDKLFVCYADKNELYSIDMQEINDAIITQSQPARLMTLCLTRMLYPVNYITVHESYLLAFYIRDRCFGRAWYYSTCCDHWHNITNFDPYIDGQWFTTEDGKAAVATLSAAWYVLYGWDITVKIHQVQLSEEY